VKGDRILSAGHTTAIVATVLAAFITAGVSLYIHFDSPEIDVSGTVSEKSKTDSDEKKSTASPTINIADIFITPIDTKMATTFFAEISNSGNEAAKDIQVTLDFGESTIKECEVQPISIASPVESEALSIQSYTISELGKDTSIYLNCAINLPYFKKIWVGGGNIQLEKSIDYDAYKELKNGESLSFYEGVLRTIVIFFLSMTAFKIIGFLFD
jgi:hypothetical protein